MLKRVFGSNKRLAQPGECFTVMFSADIVYTMLLDRSEEPAQIPQQHALPAGSVPLHSMSSYTQRRVPSTIVDLQRSVDLRRRNDMSHQPLFEAFNPTDFPWHSVSATDEARPQLTGTPSRTEDPEPPNFGDGVPLYDGDDVFALKRARNTLRPRRPPRPAQHRSPAYTPPRPRDSLDAFETLDTNINETELREKLLAMYTN